MIYSVKLTPFDGETSITYKKVKGDFVGQASEGLAGLRILILEDNSRVEYPIDRYVAQFSKERFEVLRQNMEKEAGQKLPIG
jgi:hypothetical protein